MQGCDMNPILQVPKELASSWCKEKDIPYFEVSAKNNINVAQAFETLAKQALTTVSTACSVQPSLTSREGARIAVALLTVCHHCPLAAVLRVPVSPMGRRLRSELRAFCLDFVLTHKLGASLRCFLLGSHSSACAQAEAALLIISLLCIVCFLFLFLFSSIKGFTRVI